MAQAAVGLDPVTYGGKRRSLAKALAQAGLAEDHTSRPEEAVAAPPPLDLMDMEEDTTGVFNAVMVPPPATARTKTERTRTLGRRLSSWVPAGYSPEPIHALEDPDKAAELPWLKAKRQGRILRKLKVLVAWTATLLVTGAILTAAASVMGLYPWAKAALDVVARQ